jgi:hypothetical protein
MPLEAGVFGCQQGLDHVRGNLVELHRAAVFTEVLAQQHAVGRVHFGSQVVAGIFEHAQAGHLPEQFEKVDAYGPHVADKQHQRQSERQPEPLIRRRYL